ncbi:MAG: C40 family peptidase [Cytophagales bacterium]|nr:C40 family peptidase [Cytophaga sp.]
MKQYGICHLSVVPVRKEAGDRHEMITQLLFGDFFEIILYSEEHKWVQIQNDFDGYTGWIDAKQYLSVDEEYIHKLIQTPPVFCKSLYALAKSETRFFPLLMGSTLPLYKNGIISIGDEPFILEGDVGYAESFDGRRLEQTALLYLGAPYLWGGKCHFGIDCSGFVQQLYRMFSIPLPRDASQQAEVGMTIPYEYYKQGDLAFFKNMEEKITHVGIMLDNNKIIHASGQVRMDLIDETGIIHAERKIYTHRLAFIKRMDV